MKIDCIADLHGFFPELQGGDLLIVAGDCTATHSLKEWVTFFAWLKTQKYRKKILVAGNHDDVLEDHYPQTKKEPFQWEELKRFLEVLETMYKPHFEYLCDSGTEFEGLKIWGTPWSLWFEGVNSNCVAFMGNEEKLKEEYKKIPDDIDILISHSPFHDVLDQNANGCSCGSKALKDAVNRVKPQFFVCGHIHEQGGKRFVYRTEDAFTFCVNASIVDEHYKHVNKPVRIEIENADE